MSKVFRSFFALLACGFLASSMFACGGQPDKDDAAVKKCGESAKDKAACAQCCSSAHAKNFKFEGDSCSCD
jgi:hypothetical protein